MFERRHEPLLPRTAFLVRMARHGGIALALTLVSLSIGVAGYRWFENLPWVDALLNAAMILGGMGPVDPLHTTGGKIFGAFYALFSGLIVLVVVGVLWAPFLHRLIHRFHLAGDPVEAAGEGHPAEALENSEP